MQVMRVAAAPRDVHDALDVARRLFRSGRITAALGELEELDRDAESLVSLDHVQRTTLTATRLDIALARGDLTLALARGNDLALAADPRDPVALVARGELAGALDEPNEAASHFLAAGAAEASGAPRPGRVGLLGWRAGAALALVHLHRASEARDLAEEFHRDALQFGAVFDVAQALRVRATLDPGGRRMTLLREARDVLAGEEAQRLQAQLDTDVAGMLLLAGTAEAAVQAVGLLRSAESYAGLEGLAPLRGRVWRLLERLGETPCPRNELAYTQLSGAERRVAALVLAGRSNRQVATSLSVSVKGVEWHLSRIYRKLGVGSRAELASILR